MKTSRIYHAFTLIELLTVIAIIGILSVLLSTSVTQMMARSKATKCSNNMRQIGTAAHLFSADNNLTLPVTSHQFAKGGQSWTLSLQKYAGGTLLFRCPADENTLRPFTYVINDFLTPNPTGAKDYDYSHVSRIERPSETFLYAEATKSYSDSDHFHFSTYHRGSSAAPAGAISGQIAVERHLGCANYVFADGHMETLPWEKLKERLLDPACRFLDPTPDDELVKPDSQP